MGEPRRTQCGPARENEEHIPLVISDPFTFTNNATQASRSKAELKVDEPANSGDCATSAATSLDLTGSALWVNLRSMQLTIEIPDQLARQLEPQRERLADIIARGLRRTWWAGSALRREVISFLARRPSRDEIIAFRPS